MIYFRALPFIIIISVINPNQQHYFGIAMPKNRAGIIIATFEGVKVDWLVIVAESIRMAIDRKKVWVGLA